MCGEIFLTYKVIFIPLMEGFGLQHACGVGDPISILLLLSFISKYLFAFLNRCGYGKLKNISLIIEPLSILATSAFLDGKKPCLSNSFKNETLCLLFYLFYQSVMEFGQHYALWFLVSKQKEQHSILISELASKNKNTERKVCPDYIINILLSETLRLKYLIIIR